MRKIVVGVDGSASSIEALRLAVELAGSWSARVEVVSVWQPFYGTVELPGPIEALADKAEAAVADAMAAIEPGDVEVSATVVDGDAAEVLVERSHDADMLVLGTRGRGGFAGLLLGSVSQKCAHHATCPVLIARERTGSTP